MTEIGHVTSCTTGRHLSNIVMRWNQTDYSGLGQKLVENEKQHTSPGLVLLYIYIWMEQNMFTHGQTPVL